MSIKLIVILLLGEHERNEDIIAERNEENAVMHLFIYFYIKTQKAKKKS